MPIFMDRHDVSESVTAENVAHLHEQDLKIQDQFDCRGLTYWFDDKRKTAFCLVEAPDENAIQKMHNHAHGEVPHRIIEVEPKIVESFLGRIEDPQTAKNYRLNIINDPAFRTLMVLRIKIITSKQYKLVQKYFKSIIDSLNHFNGSPVKQTDDYLLVSFESVTKAVLCSLKLISKFSEFTCENNETEICLKIGLNSGIPVNNKGSLFEETITFAERLCENVTDQIAVSSEVKELYKSENLNEFIDSESITSFTPSDEKFLNQLIDFIENVWKDAELKVDDFCKQLGFSKSQFYRKMISVTGKSPNKFLMEYRLDEAFKLINKQSGNISEIAFETGFNSLSYFSKCFRKKYGRLPSEYLQSNVA